VTMQTTTIGSGPRVALVGGGLTGWLSWVPHAERLAATRTVTRCQPLAVQLGLEDKPLPERYSVEMESHALAQALDTEPLDLVAWSYGGVIALDYALDHPERIRSLTLIEPPAFWVLSATNRFDEESRRQSTAMRELHASMTGDVSEDQLAQFCIQAGFVPAGVRPQDQPQWNSWVEHRRSLRTGTAVWDHVGSRERLEAFPHPMLLVKGTGSMHYLHRIVDAIASLPARVEVIELPAGHAPQLVSFDQFLGALERFHANAR
jgi:pimeloyl-ACP methyl ester carboxylesterase